MPSAEHRLQTLGLHVPPPTPAAASYVPYLIHGDHLYISGQLPMENGLLKHAGRLGDDLDTFAGQQAARLCGLHILSQIKAALGTLDKVSAIIKITGYVASAPDFHEHHKVLNGASDLMMEIFGEQGRHTRAALGVVALPLGAAVEIEAIIKIA
jgi:enamine deaminase RidA (YjgF/YER057c/UK114 family)